MSLKIELMNLKIELRNNMDDILLKIKELDSYCDALTDNEIIEKFIKQQMEVTRLKFCELVANKEAFLEGIDRIEKQMIEEYTKGKKGKK